MGKIVYFLTYRSSVLLKLFSAWATSVLQLYHATGLLEKDNVKGIYQLLTVFFLIFPLMKSQNHSVNLTSRSLGTVVFLCEEKEETL